MVRFARLENRATLPAPCVSAKMVIPNRRCRELGQKFKNVVATWPSGVRQSYDAVAAGHDYLLGEGAKQAHMYHPHILNFLSTPR